MTDNAQAWTVYNSLMVDPLTHTVYSAGEEVHLPEMEYQLLYYFLQHPGQTLSRKTLMLAVWGAPPGLKTRTLDSYHRWTRFSGGHILRCFRFLPTGPDILR